MPGIDPKRPFGYCLALSPSANSLHQTLAAPTYPCAILHRRGRHQKALDQLPLGGLQVNLITCRSSRLRASEVLAQSTNDAAYSAGHQIRSSAVIRLKQYQASAMLLRMA